MCDILVMRADKDLGILKVNLETRYVYEFIVFISSDQFIDYRVQACNIPCYQSVH